MADALFEDPRLAAVYDALNGERDDLEVYAAMAVELGARRVVDVGCGTGTFALMLAARGLEVVGVDPAAASVDVARRKPGAAQVEWIVGDATVLPAGLQTDLVMMTANVAQAIVDPADWRATLESCARVLRPGGHLVFETRDPAREAWRDWNPRDSRVSVDVAGLGQVQSWQDVTSVDGPLVTFTSMTVFADGDELESVSTLRFRSREEVEASLTEAGLAVVEVRDAPDRPGRELVFVARKPG